jgi:hypothetical protein
MSHLLTGVTREWVLREQEGDGYARQVASATVRRLDASAAWPRVDVAALLAGQLPSASPEPVFGHFEGPDVPTTAAVAA